MSSGLTQVEGIIAVAIDTTHLVSSVNGLVGAISIASSDGTITITPSGTTINLSASGSEFWTASSNNIYNNNTGNVGIGDTNPTVAKLTVLATGQAGRFTSTFSPITGGNIITDWINNGVTRSQLFDSGSAVWYLNSGSAEIGSIGYSTPGGSPGITFQTGSSYNLNRFDAVNAGNYFSLAYNADGGGTGLNIAAGGGNGASVGIGPGSNVPSARADIRTNNSTDLLHLTAASQAPYFTRFTNSTFSASPAFSTYVNNDGTTHLVQESTAALGISTTAGTALALSNQGGAFGSYGFNNAPPTGGIIAPGNAGFGLNNPTRRVSITSSSADAYMSFNPNASETWVMGSDNSGVAGAQQFILFSGGAYRAVMTLGGNFGIATSSPPGALSVASASIGTSVGTGTSAWSNKYSIFGPNVGSTTGAAIGLGYDNTGDAGVLISIAPNTAWKPMNYLALSHNFYVNGGTTSAVSITSTGNLQAGNIIANSINIATSKDFTIGKGASAAGGDTIAIGLNAQVDGAQGGLAIGPDFGSGGAYASGVGAIAIGGGSVSEGFGSLAIGNGATAAGDGALSVGEDVFAVTSAAGFGANLDLEGTSTYGFGGSVSTGSASRGTMVFGALDTTAVLLKTNFTGNNSAAFVMGHRTGNHALSNTLIVMGGGLLVDPNATGLISTRNGSIDFSRATDAMTVPTGTTAQRPTGVNGMQRYNSDINAQEYYANGSWVPAATGATLFTHFADVGNGTTVETDLYSDTIAAGQLSVNGQRLEGEYGGIFVSSATATREIKLYFGGTAIFDTGALTLSLSSAWTLYATIIRVSATVVRYMISFTTEGAALSAYTATGELTGLTLSATNVLKITGQAGGVGAATNDIVAKLGAVDFKP